jgi:hypothetical protein
LMVLKIMETTFEFIVKIMSPLIPCSSNIN